MQCDAPTIVTHGHEEAWSFFGYLKFRTVWFFRFYFFYFISFFLGISIIIVFWAIVFICGNCITASFTFTFTGIFLSLADTLNALFELSLLLGEYLKRIPTDFSVHTMWYMSATFDACDSAKFSSWLAQWKYSARGDTSWKRFAHPFWHPAMLPAPSYVWALHIVGSSPGLISACTIWLHMACSIQYSYQSLKRFPIVNVPHNKS